MWFIIGLLIGAIITFVIQYPKLKTFINLDKETAQKNQEIYNQLQKTQQELNLLLVRKEETITNLKDLELYAQTAGEKFYEKNIQLAESNFEYSAEKMAEEFRQHKQEIENEYFQMMEEASQSLSKQLTEQRNILVELEIAINQKKSEVAAAVEASKRAEELKNKSDFYRMILSEEDKEEIKKLREVSNFLRNKEPLNKVIWKVYYEKPYTDMIGRIVGSGNHCGIYKITNIKNNMCYIGQAVNIADRWKQHIKRGLGAEAPTRNKLYPAMMSFGVENFTFEIIEECDRSLLDSKEDYWQDYFKAKEFGYSIK